MPSMDCLQSDGSGYAEDAVGADIICPLCEGTGVVLTDEDQAEKV